MNVNFCFNSNSFTNSGENLNYIYNRIEELDQIIENINKINERKIKLDRPRDIVYKDLNIYDQLIYNSKNIIEFIYSKDNISADHQKILRSIIDKAPHHTEEEIHNNISFYDRSPQCIYNKDNLINFYYSFFKTLIDSDDFYYGIKIHFTKLTFSDNVKDTLNNIEADLQNFAEKFIKTLIYLNDRIQDIFQEIGDIRATLERLTEDISFHASVQGKSKTKLNFEFVDSSSNEIRKIICCDPHVKYNRGEEVKSDKEYYRLYFHMGDPKIDNGNVLIGHIGIHIE